MTVTVYIGLGSNLDNPIEQITQACAEINRSDRIQLIKLSGLYRSSPLGPQAQPDFVNAVAEIATNLQPQALLAVLQGLEQIHGRTDTGLRWGPRPLDLDILLYGQLMINCERLVIPHRGLFERSFVLYPLQEIASDQLHIPGHGSLGALIKNCPRGDLEFIQPIVIQSNHQQ